MGQMEKKPSKTETLSIEVFASKTDLIALLQHIVSWADAIT